MTNIDNNTVKSVLSGNYNAWADIVIKTWRQRQVSTKVGEYRTRGKRKVSHEPLYNSFQRHIMNMTGASVKQIDFMFKEYGIFVDMGVGRETGVGNSGDLEEYAIGKKGKKHLKRRRKEWYSKVWYREVMALQEELARRMGKAAAITFIENLSVNLYGSIGDTKHARYRERNIALRDQ